MRKRWPWILFGLLLLASLSLRRGRGDLVGRRPRHKYALMSTTHTVRGVTSVEEKMESMTLADGIRLVRGVEEGAEPAPWSRVMMKKSDELKKVLDEEVRPGGPQFQKKSVDAMYGALRSIFMVLDEIREELAQPAQDRSIR